jgi:hypothetical protein
MKKEEKDAVKFKKYMNSVKDYSLEGYARQLVLKKLGVVNCGATCTLEELPVFTRDQSYTIVTSSLAAAKIYNNQLAQYATDPTVVCIVPWMYDGIKEFLTEGLMQDRAVALGLGFEPVAHLTPPNFHGREANLFFIRLSGARWFEVLTEESHANHYNGLAVEDTIRDFQAAWKCGDSVELTLSQVQVPDFKKGSWDEYCTTAWSDLRMDETIRGVGGAVYQVRIKPIEGTLIKNADLFVLLGYQIKNPCALKQGRELMGKITGKLNAYEKKALIALENTNGNKVGACVEIKDQIETTRRQLGVLINCLAYIEKGDFSTIDAAAAEVVDDCMKLVAKKGLDPRIQKLAARIIQSL